MLKARGKKLQGVEGAIAELIVVPSDYEVAIETALGGSMQHVVVRNEQDGRNAIQYLKQNHFGRATFLPMSVIKGKELALNQLRLIENHPAFVGVASNLISFNPMYSEIVKNVLGLVVITKDLKGAGEMAKLLQYRCRFVTLDGDVVNSGGSMTGGALKKNSSSLLSRKSELDELKERLADMEIKTSKLETLVKQLKNDLAVKELDFESLRKKGESLRLKEQAIKGELRETELQEKNMNERLSLYDLNKKEFIEENVKISDRRTSLEALLVQLKENILTLENDIQQLNEKKNTQTLSKDTLLTEISELKVLLAAKNEQVNYTNEKLSTTHFELEENSNRLQFYQEDLQLLSSEMSESSSGEVKLAEAAKDKLRKKMETLDLISSGREDRSNIQASLENLDLETKELKRQHKGMSAILQDEEVQLNRLDVELDNKLAHLREEYLLSFEGAKEEYPSYHTN